MDTLPKERSAPRITVVDSMELEREVYTYLKKAVLVDKFLPSKLLEIFEFELDVLLKIIMWTFSVSKHNATFGQQFLHLKYSNESLQQNLKHLGILTIGATYLKEKVSAAALSRSSSSQLLSRYFRYLETTFYLLNIFNFLRFIRMGGSPTFQENILNLKPVSTVSLSSRIIQHSSMTRELLWNSFIETFLLLIPLINYTKWKRRLEIFFERSKSTKFSVSNFKNSHLLNCVSCNDTAILPCELGCHHFLCYYCFTSNVLADSSYECPQCGFSNISTVKPLYFQV